MASVVNMRDRPDLRAALDRAEEQGDAVRIDRRTRWGNPFLIGRHGTREEIIERYRSWLWQKVQSGEFPLSQLAALNGKKLACWCHPQPCHGDVLAKAARWPHARLAVDMTLQHGTPGEAVRGPAPIYAGVGARKTPEPVLGRMRDIATNLGGRGWHMRTGGAKGADDAFARAVPAERRTVFIPWRGYNGWSGSEGRALGRDALVGWLAESDSMATPIVAKPEPVVAVSIDGAALIAACRWALFENPPFLPAWEIERIACSARFADPDLAALRPELAGRPVLLVRWARAAGHAEAIARRLAESSLARWHAGAVADGRAWAAAPLAPVLKRVGTETPPFLELRADVDRAFGTGGARVAYARNAAGGWTVRIDDPGPLARLGPVAGGIAGLEILALSRGAGGPWRLEARPVAPETVPVSRLEALDAAGAGSGPRGLCHHRRPAAHRQGRDDRAQPALARRRAPVEHRAEAAELPLSVRNRSRRRSRCRRVARHGFVPPGTIPRPPPSRTCARAAPSPGSPHRGCRPDEHEMPPPARAPPPAAEACRTRAGCACRPISGCRWRLWGARRSPIYTGHCAVARPRSRCCPKRRMANRPV